MYVYKEVIVHKNPTKVKDVVSAVANFISLFAITALHHLEETVLRKVRSKKKKIRKKKVRTPQERIQHVDYRRQFYKQLQPRFIHTIIMPPLPFEYFWTVEAKAHSLELVSNQQRRKRPT